MSSVRKYDSFHFKYCQRVQMCQHQHTPDKALKEKFSILRKGFIRFTLNKSALSSMILSSSSPISQERAQELGYTLP